MTSQLLIALFALSPIAYCQAPARQITKIVSSTGTTNIAPGAVAIVYGIGLTDSVEAASQLPLPIELGGISVTLNDAKHSAQAQLLYASPTQINMVVPESFESGNIDVTVASDDFTYATSTIALPVVPAVIFTADGSGTGAAAGFAVRSVLPTHFQGLVSIYSCDRAGSICAPIPLNTGIDAPLTLVLFGTGIRAGATVTATIGGKTAPVNFVGAQPQFPGISQIHLPLGLSLRGAGTVDVVVTVDGQASNPVQIAIQ